jgi:hypothetical protein
MRVLRIISIFWIIWAGTNITLAQTTNPHGNINWECFDCHNTSSWNEIKQPNTFNHDKTGFTLLGKHANVACRGCHRDLKFAFIGTSCSDCHTDIHRGQFGNACQSCHTSQNWQNRQDAFELHASRGFPLVGIHAIADCEACHIGQQRNEFSGTSTECQGCHQSNFLTASNPNHTEAGFQSAECRQCHLPVSSSWNKANYQHPAAFLLHGAHSRIDCNSCHSAGYNNISVECSNCHIDVYNSSINPAHATFGFPTTCAICHDDVSWNDARFDHLQASNFALAGAHATIRCDQCHVNNQIHGLPQDCFGCHQADFQRVTDPGHTAGNFPHDCTLCHSENSWSPATFDHNQSGFPLTGAHASLQCGACHANGYQNTPADCFSCHQNDFNGASDPNHAANNFNHDCTQCHTTIAWQPASFNHANTRFPLTGAHLSLSCISCHSSGYQNTPYDCYSCHANDYNGASNPNHASNNFDHNCTQCHTTNAWQPATFDHANTRFPLTGAHVSLSCISCHSGGYQNTPVDCYSCHANDYIGATDPNHVANNFSHDCTQCHSTSRWDDGTFNHNNTQFPLTGAHTAIQCIACHANGYQNTPTDCYSCHQTDFNNVSDPSHLTNNFSHICTQCHTTAAWNPASFDHNQTQFPLTGAHISLSCISCHANGYQNTSRECFACHQNDYNNVSDPNHVQNNFDHNCTQCHTTSAWTPATFDHANTRFPLTGAHVSLSCISCHSNGYQNTPYDCYSCHTNDFNGATNPSHSQNNFDHNCTLCHSTSAWQPSTFDHNTTHFPLTGAHVPLACIACHSNGYQNTPFDCYSCHAADYNGATDPNHVANNFSHDCTQCHNTSGWDNGTFNHNNTPFPLTGAHASLQCIACHANGYQNTPNDCYSCHQTDFNNVSDPSHVQNNFNHDCTQCHTTAVWNPASFDHGQTRFPLTGAHTSLVCISCHSSGYQNTPYDCYSCHQTNFNSVSDPNHVQDNFSHICTDCHTTAAWSPATFNHNNSPFPLTGAHASQQCVACHTSGYDNTPTDCYACHLNDYNGSSNPNHRSMGFPTLCQTCHSTTAWQPSTWNHDSQYFPIFSGNHQGRWSTCADCHINPNDFTAFECILCHAHNRTEMDSQHQNVSGYQYLSSACYSCHPRGGGGG